ncbi:MAG: T9SS C-terminal target domain-containing protein [Winogradskyella sp.]|uniref:T9SS type A sorting domain-containing protein n=1 Tax=Winogradskyella sp. TaxID=1883156 RepID=UPI000F401F8A|nr:T9SS type A sorting domain-containing protein [Winogradskyella sp.]RNC88321.1 MAG: T9SS C-terminal target domain-containing protein [Winogradskyella sp.]
MKRNYYKVVFSVFALLNYITAFSQANNTHVCTMPDTGAPNNTLVKLRPLVKQKLESRATPCATINVNYIGGDWTDIFGQPNEAQDAFQLAVDIWANLIDSPVTININATYEPSTPGNLGSASASYFRSIPGDPDNVLYPGALFEKITGANGNGFSSDISCNFNSTRSDWFFPTAVDEPTPAGMFNFTSVVLHELGHGLGIAGFGRTRIGTTGTTVGYIRRDSNGNTTTAANDPAAIWYNIWDEFIVNSSTPVLDLDDPSSFLLSAFQGDNLSCNGPIAVAQNGGVRPKTYAPFPFNGGSSYSHWDEATFNGTETALMTPFLGPGESVYDPGNVTLGFMEDMGWSLCQGSLSANDFAIDDINISPNPFTESITIELPPRLSNNSFSARITDINGREVYGNLDFNNGEIIISNLSNLKNALYFLTIENKTSNISITKKIIKK